MYKAKAEIRILLGYLPQQLSKEEISEIVRQAVRELGVSSMRKMAKVVAAVTPKTKGRTDGRLVNQIVKQYLNK
jgi:hypothetical protein